MDAANETAPRQALKMGNAAFLLVGAGVYVATGGFVMALAGATASDLTLIWLPAGVGVVMFLRAGAAAAPAVFAASLILNAIAFETDALGAWALQAVIAALGESTGQALAALVIRTHFAGGLRSAEALWRFSLFACAAPAAATAAVLVPTFVAAGHVPLEAAATLFGSIVFADALSVQLIFILWTTVDAQDLRTPPRIDRALWSGLGALICVPLAFHIAPFFIALVPLAMVHLAMQGDAARVAVAKLALVVALLVAAAVDLGPFGLFKQIDAAVFLSVFAFATIQLTSTVFLYGRELDVLGRAHDDWRRRAETDSLTGLLNRAAFFDAVSAHNALGRKGCLAVLDLDRFKQINDRYGHDAGDRALIALAQTMASTLRRGDRLGRLGGEEFGVLLADCDPKDARASLDGLRLKIADIRIDVDAETFGFTASIGAAPLDAAQNRQTLYRRADSALYAAKNGGRDQVRLAV